MFQETIKSFQEAEKQVDEINEKYEQLRKKLSINIQQIIIEEVKEIGEGYSPLNFQENLNLLVDKYKALDEEKELEIEKIKQELEKLIFFKPQVTEMYKIIGPSARNKNYICRVWFTLVPIKKWNCVPGDPIRVEWLNFSETQARLDDKIDRVCYTSRRNDPGPEGLQMPEFESPGIIINSVCTYPRYHFGVNSDKIKWWDEWVAKNRPL